MLKAPHFHWIAVLAVAGLVVGQEPSVQRIGVVPPWPADGSISEELRHLSVFFDPRSNELVIISSMADYLGAREIPLRFELHNQAASILTSKVTRDERGLYIYEYSVVAGLTSRRPLSRWSLLIPGGESQLTIGSASSWDTEHADTDMVDRLPSKHTPLRYVHFTAKPGAEFAPGSGASGFSIVSKYAPGYVTSFARSTTRTELPYAKLLGLPKAVLEQVQRATAPHLDNQTALVIGPRFDRDTPMATVASSFDYAIQHYSMGKGELSPVSEFVKLTSAALRSFTENGAELAIPTDLLSKARSPREKEIANALKMSLTQNR